MSTLKLLTYRDMARVAEMAGFHWKRCRGSHNTFQASDGRIVVIPDHGNQVLIVWPPCLIGERRTSR